MFCVNVQFKRDSKKAKDQLKKLQDRIKKKAKADEEAAREKNTSAFAKKHANKRAREKSAAQALAE